MEKKDFLIFSPEIAAARAEKKPIVALESTIISHGMPYPRNIGTALEVEETVRRNGAVPATIAIINGKIRIGLGKDEIEFLARSSDVRKASRRDLALVLSRGENASTTVAATMILSALAGMEIFATGGIGGVHRGAAETFDISADLKELSHTPVTVICAGAKAILDIGLTLEYLETFGVPIIGYKTDSFPAFYTHKSGYSLEYRADTPEEIARFLNIKKHVTPEGGVLIANPVPEEYSLDPEFVERTVTAALEEARAKGITGKAVTPFLLSRMEAHTGGESLKTNIALIKNNAALAARIAAAAAAASAGRSPGTA